MKYVLILCMVVALLVTPAFADAGDDGSGSLSATYITVPAPDVYITVEDNTSTVLTAANDSGYTLRSSFGDALVSIFGEYTPRTQTVIVHDADGSVYQYEQYVPGVAGMDWVWLSGVGLFGLFLFCLMKLLGGAVK